MTDPLVIATEDLKELRSLSIGAKGLSKELRIKRPESVKTLKKFMLELALKYGFDPDNIKSVNLTTGEVLEVTASIQVTDPIVIEPDEMAELIRRTEIAKETPVICITGHVDMATLAWRDVKRYWKELGRKYGFDPEKIAGIDKRTCTVQQVTA